MHLSEVTKASGELVKTGVREPGDSWLSNLLFFAMPEQRAFQNTSSAQAVARTGEAVVNSVQTVGTLAGYVPWIVGGVLVLLVLTRK